VLTVSAPDDAKEIPRGTRQQNRTELPQCIARCGILTWNGMSSGRVIVRGGGFGARLADAGRAG
jgi:hypothetical protein